MSTQAITQILGILKRSQAERWGEGRLLESVGKLCAIKAPGVEALPEIDFTDLAQVKKTYGLNDGQARFVQEYLVDCNGQQAAIRAGYSKKTAGAQASNLLKNPKVKAALGAAQKELSERVQIKQDRVLLELARLGFSNISDYLAWGPDGVTMVASASLTKAQTACIAEITETVNQNGRQLRFRLHNKNAALETIAKHLGMLVERREISGPGGGPVEMKRSVEDLSDEELMEIIAKGKGEKE